MLLFGWNRKTEKCITLYLQPLYRLDNSLYHFPNRVSYLLHELTTGYFDYLDFYFFTRFTPCMCKGLYLKCRAINYKFAKNAVFLSYARIKQNGAYKPGVRRDTYMARFSCKLWNVLLLVMITSEARALLVCSVLGWRGRSITSQKYGIV